MASNASALQTSFLGGEVSPYAQGAIDHPEYKKAMNACLNAFPLEEGAWTRRSGTRHGAATYGNQYARLFRFEFEQQAPNFIEVTPGSIRVWASSIYQGGLSTALPQDYRLVTSGTDQSVTSITSASPSVVTTGSAHGWATGDQVEFLFAQTVAPGVTPLLRNRVFTITVLTTTTFSIADDVTGSPVSIPSFTPLAAGLMVVARIFRTTNPYTASDLPFLRKVQAEGNAIFLHPNYAPLVLASTPPTPTAFASFTAMTALTMNDGPYLDPPADGSTLTPSATTGTITLTASTTASINGGSGFQSTDVGRCLRLYCQPAAWVSTTAYTAGQSVVYGGVPYTALTGSTNAQPNISPVAWAIDTTKQYWAWGTIQSVTSTLIVTWAQSTDTINPTVAPTVLLNTNAISVWRLGTYSGTSGWPTCGTYYEGRLWFAGAYPNRVDAGAVNALGAKVTQESTQHSQHRGYLGGGGGGTNTQTTAVVFPYVSFAPTNFDSTVTASNGMSLVFNSDDANPIFWMIGNQTGILCGTQAGEWMIQASAQSNPITPTSVQAHRVTKYGCANIEPENAEITTVFVHRYNLKMLEFFPDVFSGRYTAPNLAHRVGHMFANGAAEIRFQQQPTPIVWMRDSVGNLFGTSYRRTSLFSSQGPEFNGWHRHQLGSGRSAVSISTGPSADGTIDTLGLVTYDGTRYDVEFMQPYFAEAQTIANGWFLDNAIVPSDGSVTLSSGGNTITFRGLWHLNGQTCTVVVNGIDCGDATVSNGAITVPIDTQYTALFTSANLIAANQTTTGPMTVPVYIPAGAPGVVLSQTVYANVLVGFNYVSQGQLLRPDTPEENRSPTGPGMGKPRRIQQYSLLLANAQGISVGTSFTNLVSCNFRQLNGGVWAANNLFSGVYWDTLPDTNSFDGMFCWQVSRPYPATVLSVNRFLHMEDR